MLALTSLLSLLFVLPRVLSVDVSATCTTLEGELPVSSVFYSGEFYLFRFPIMLSKKICLVLGSPEYTEAMRHFSVMNVQQSACVVQPATQDHISTIVHFSPSIYRRWQAPDSFFNSLKRCPRQEPHLP